MLSIQEVFDLFSKVGCCSFATLDDQGGVDSRIAHFVAWDSEGLYFTTMTGKPFYRQLKAGSALSACGEFTEMRCYNDEDNLPKFAPGFMIRVSGHVRELTSEEIEAHAEVDPNFNVVVYDTGRYPETTVFVLDRAWGELYDYDFNMVNRDHKIERERFAWGEATFVDPGFHITDACIGCGSCMTVCTHKAIVAGSPYRILGERCDECGNCHHVCPVGAIEEKGILV